MTALAMELLALNLRRVPTQSAALERSEYARRDRDIIWYLLRGSLWEGWTKFVPCFQTVAAVADLYDLQAEVGEHRGQDRARPIDRRLWGSGEGLDTADRRVLLLCVSSPLVCCSS